MNFGLQKKSKMLMNASYKLTSAIKKPSAITSPEPMSVNAKMALVETDFCATM